VGHASDRRYRPGLQRCTGRGDEVDELLSSLVNWVKDFVRGYIEPIFEDIKDYMDEYIEGVIASYEKALDEYEKPGQFLRKQRKKYLIH